MDPVYHVLDNLSSSVYNGFASAFSATFDAIGTSSARRGDLALTLPADWAKPIVSVLATVFSFPPFPCLRSGTWFAIGATFAVFAYWPFPFLAGWANSIGSFSVNPRGQRPYKE